MGFEVFDLNGDGLYTIEECRQHAKPLITAVESKNLEIIRAWLKQTSVVELPEGWLEDHFAHSEIWTFLSQLDIPIGVFHGEADAHTPVKGVRTIECLAQTAGKGDMEFHYFPDLDHSLGGLEYFQAGIPSKGYQAIFEYVRRQVLS